MKLEGRIIRVKSLKAPVVEIDTATESAYVGFSSNRVARTVFRSEHQGPVVTIDFDEKENVVGIELIGLTEFGIQSLLAFYTKLRFRLHPNCSTKSVTSPRGQPRSLLSRKLIRRLRNLRLRWNGW